jgi:hypothetical protein
MQLAGPPKKIERRIAADKREVFFNYGEVRYTVNDFLLSFAIIRDAGPNAEPGTVTITNILDVCCSPQNMKTLAQTVSNMVATYERQYGPIPQEPTPAGPVN